jgi:hypothetical protein
LRVLNPVGASRRGTRPRPPRDGGALPEARRPRLGWPQRGAVRKRRLGGRVRRCYRPAPAPMEGAGALNASLALALDLKLPLSLGASRREVAARTRLWAIGSPTQWTRGFGLTGCSTIVVNEAQLFDWTSRFSCKLKGDRRGSNPRLSEPQSADSCFWVLLCVAQSACISRFLCSRLPTVSAYCALSGVKKWCQIAPAAPRVPMSLSAPRTSPGPRCSPLRFHPSRSDALWIQRGC